MKRVLSVLCAAVLAAGLAGCGGSAASSLAVSESAAQSTASSAASEGASSVSEAALPDGVYTAKFDTDSSMFHVNETCDGKGVLTVENGQMSIYVKLAGKGIVNLYAGTAEDAQKEGAQLLEPSMDTVAYSDGTTEEVCAFTIPVPYLDEEFDVALVGKKGTWYDHKVSVSDPEPMQEESAALEDGAYTAEVTLEGGSGRASVQSPAELTVQNGQMTAKIVWSSKNYDLMIVDGTEYTPTYENDLSVFEIPVSALDTAIAVQAETTAMSQPHLIDYTLTFTNAEAAQ